MSDSLTAALVSAVAMTAIVGGRYVLTSGLFAWITSRVRPGLYRNMRPQIGREVRWSLLSAAIYGVPAGIVAWGWQERGWTRIYTEAGAYPWWWLPASLFVYLFLHDTWFYWTHRWMHRPRPFALTHAVHHASRPPTAWAAMSFHPLEAITGAVVIPALVLVIPIHVSAPSMPPHMLGSSTTFAFVSSEMRATVSLFDQGAVTITAPGSRFIVSTSSATWLGVGGMPGFASIEPWIAMP